jgi:two-component system response regulator GlrR
MRFLVVEDDDGVRRLIKLVLTEAGHTVASYDSAERALHVPAEIKRADVIIADAKLPGMGGLDFAHSVMTARPEACVLIITGFTEDRKLRARARSRGVHILDKPFTPRKLLATIARICG